MFKKNLLKILLIIVTLEQVSIVKKKIEFKKKKMLQNQSLADLSQANHL